MSLEIQDALDTIIKSLSISERRLVDRDMLAEFIKKRLQAGDIDRTTLILAGMSYVRSQKPGG